NRRRGSYEHVLVPTDDHGHWHLLAAILVLAEVLAPSLCHGEQNSNGVFLADHAAVGPRVEDPCVGISGNDTRGRHDETATIVRIPFRNRKLKQIHRVALDDVFFNRSFAHGDWFYRFGEAVFENGDQLTVRGLFRNTEQTAYPFPCPCAVGK